MLGASEGKNPVSKTLSKYTHSSVRSRQDLSSLFVENTASCDLIVSAAAKARFVHLSSTTLN